MSRSVPRQVVTTVWVTCALMLLPGCDRGSDSSGAGSEPTRDIRETVSNGVAAHATPRTADEPGLSRSDEKAIADTLRSWLLTGDCALMSDRFVRAQTARSTGDRAARCAAFEQSFTVPALTARDIIVKEFASTPRGATAVVTDDHSGVAATYTLERGPTGWRIDDWSL